MPVSEKAFSQLSEEFRALEKEFHQSKEFHNLSQSVAAIKGSLVVVKWIVGLSFPVVAAACIWCFHLGTKVTAIEQQLADGGNAKIVAELKAPKSSGQLQANLSTVIAQVQTARVDGKQPNAKKVNALSDALSEVVKKDPQLPETWQAASVLINYRSTPNNSSGSNACDKPYRSQGALPTQKFDPDGPIGVILYYRDCVMDIGDPSPFEGTTVARILHIEPGERVAVGISLENVRVVYHGGPLLPVVFFTFSNCTFDFQMSTPPPQDGISLTQTLLAANDIKNVKFGHPIPNG